MKSFPSSPITELGQENNLRKLLTSHAVIYQTQNSSSEESSFHQYICMTQHCCISKSSPRQCVSVDKSKNAYKSKTKKNARRELQNAECTALLSPLLRLALPLALTTFIVCLGGHRSGSQHFLHYWLVCARTLIVVMSPW